MFDLELENQLRRQSVNTFISRIHIRIVQFINRIYMSEYITDYTSVPGYLHVVIRCIINTQIQAALGHLSDTFLCDSDDHFIFNISYIAADLFQGIAM